MATYVPPKRATELIFYAPLRSQLNAELWQVNPTIAAGDFKVAKDGGAYANLTTLPAVTPAGGVDVKFVVSATEMTADNVSIIGIDVAGAEWCDFKAGIQTSAQQIDDLVSLTATIAEPAGIFAWPATVSAILGWLGVLSRNKITQTATAQAVRNDADSGTIATSTVSDDSTTFTRGEFS